MKPHIIFIDDEYSSRLVYESMLQDMYGEEFTVVAIGPEKTIGDMFYALDKYENLASIIVDEKLQVQATTNYRGSNLVEALRGRDSKLPIFILTSEVSLIPPPFGSADYIIDKNKIGEEEYQKQLTMLMLRHLLTFKDIKSVRAKRFDELLKKSLKQPLSIEEMAEYEELDFTRSNAILSSEKSPSSAELDKQQEILEQIEQKLKTISKE
jgi:hypothetical protein